MTTAGWSHLTLTLCNEFVKGRRVTATSRLEGLMRRERLRRARVALAKQLDDRKAEREDGRSEDSAKQETRADCWQQSDGVAGSSSLLSTSR